MSTTDNSFSNTIPLHPFEPTAEVNMQSIDNPKCPSPIVLRIEELILKNGVPNNQVRNAIINITGLSKAALVKWFSGDTTAPTIDHIIKIREKYDADLVWLITGETNKQQQNKDAFQEKENPPVPVNIGHADSVVVHGGQLTHV